MTVERSVKRLHRALRIDVEVDLPLERAKHLAGQMHALIREHALADTNGITHFLDLTPRQAAQRDSAPLIEFVLRPSRTDIDEFARLVGGPLIGMKQEELVVGRNRDVQFRRGHAEFDRAFDELRRVVRKSGSSTVGRDEDSRQKRLSLRGSCRQIRRQRNGCCSGEEFASGDRLHC